MGIDFYVAAGRGEQDWDDIVENAFFSDVFHTAAYTKVFSGYEGASPEIILYAEGPYFIALPLLVRAIPQHNGLFDAISVYGYAGPIASHSVGDLPQEVITRFQSLLSLALTERRIVSLFCRLHPLLPQSRIVAGLGSGASRVGEVVSIDLTVAPDEQWRMMRRNHRQDIRKLRLGGVRCDLDAEWNHLDDFVDLYQANMRRLGTGIWYHFNKRFFRAIRDRLSDRLFLFICKHEDEVCGGLIVSMFRNVAHTFLSAPGMLTCRPPVVKVAFDAARIWAGSAGARTLVLGGGVGSHEDSLFHFKAGFSNQRQQFAVWRWVVMPEQYDMLCCRAGVPPADVIDIPFPGYRNSNGHLNTA